MVYAPDESPSQPQQDPLNSMVFYASAIAIVVFFAISSFTGVHKGIRRLSELDMLLALVLSSLTFILRDPHNEAPAWKRILWAAISGVLTREAFAQPAFNSFRGEELSPGKEVQSDEEYR